MEAAIKQEPVIRLAIPNDAEALLAIYAPYVRDTAITFEYDVPALPEFRKRIESILEKYPYLVAERNGIPTGYAYAGPFHPRAAYQHSAELSIYLSQDSRGQGIGKALYRHLEEILLSQGVYNLEACITLAEKGDPYVPSTSPLFHRALGFRTVARFTQCGYKFGRWFDVIWMEKLIGQRPVHPEPFIPFPELAKR